jgi:hypothetical protein
MFRMNDFQWLIILAIIGYFAGILAVALIMIEWVCGG